MPRGHCHRHAGERPCTCAMGNLYRFVEPVVLYILARDGSTYGYELTGRAADNALTDAEIDSGAVYRTLQRLESAGHVTSDWDTAGPGPARHVYSITESGRKHLKEWAVVLKNLSTSLNAFADQAESIEARQPDSSKGK